MSENNETDRLQSDAVSAAAQTNEASNPDTNEVTPSAENAGSSENTGELQDDAVEAEESSAAIIEESQGSKTLEEALEKFNIKLPAKKVRLLNEYCDLLWTWNERLNLTRHTNYDKFVARDLIDSIHLAALLQKGEHVLDVGSGGGVPGLVVAILRPDVVVELCEATGKKATALGAMVDALGLDLNVWYSKAQDLVRERHFHTLTIRAVDKMRNLLLMFGTTWHCFNRILMIKGPKWPDERGEARHYNMFNALALRKLDEYTVPGPEAEEFTSVILQVCRKNRLEELQRRAADLAEGKPYEGAVEEIVVDNRPIDAPQRGSREDRRRGEGRRYGREKSRSFITVKDGRGDFDSKDTDAAGNSKAYARRSGKPPKGWTGKKSEFRAEAHDGDASKDSAPRKDWRGARKGGYKKSGARGSSNGRSFRKD